MGYIRVILQYEHITTVVIFENGWFVRVINFHTNFIGKSQGQAAIVQDLYDFLFSILGLDRLFAVVL